MQLEDDLTRARERSDQLFAEQNAVAEFESHSREEAEAARRIQRRLEREIKDIARLEEKGFKNEAEAMAREERFQRQYAAKLDANRAEDIKLELSAMNAEDRASRNFREHLRDLAEEEAVRQREVRVCEERKTRAGARRAANTPAPRFARR